MARSRGGVIVRRARPGDLDGLLVLLGQLEDAPIERAPPFEQTFQAIISEPYRALLVAEHEGRLVGTLDLVIVSSLTHGCRPWGVIENVVVDAGRRRRGVGSALLARAGELALDAGCTEVQLVSHERRREAHQLYASAGFNAPVRGFRRYLDPALAAARGQSSGHGS